jgi:hypothetical protein
MSVFGNFWRNCNGIGEKARRSVGEDLSVAKSVHGGQSVFRVFVPYSLHSGALQ